MTKIPATLRCLVIQRANNRCEYCGISRVGLDALRKSYLIQITFCGQSSL